MNNVNILITEDNKLFNNISDEKEKLKSDFIRYAFSNVNVDFIEKDIDILKSEVKSLTKDVLDLEKREREIDESLDKINNKFQNTEIVCKCINRYLHDYGYSSFLLKYNSESTYSIIREDGEEALKTLSEGEKNFLAFLYFYFTIKNSENYIALNNYDVVAIDDPISSLDSHALYIVSQLTLDLIDDLTFKHKNKVPGQIFIFSHNLFYINDIDSSLTANKNKLSRRYFILKKRGKSSIVKKTSQLPLKSEYTLMWYQYFDLVKAIEKDSDNEFNFITTQNLMRRILETYFKFIGNVRYTELLKNIKKSKPQEDFTGLDSMVIWLNQGSHGVAIESYCVPKDSEEVKYFIEQFKKLFKYLGHEQHYQMMEESNNKISEMK